MRHTVVSDLAKQYHYIADVAQTRERETAVLYRNNDSAIPIIDVLDKIGVKFAGGPTDSSFFTNYIVRDIVNIIRFALATDSLEFFLQVYRQLDLRLRADAIDRLKARRSHTRGRCVLKALLADRRLGETTASRVEDLRVALGDIRGARGSDVVTAVIELTGYGRYLKSGRADSTRITVLKSLAEQNSGAAVFLRRLGELRQLIDAGLADGASDENRGLFLTTIHSAKGLEFEHVIIIDAIAGVLPSVRVPKDGESISERALATLEEERRLFYVGVTRAKERLEVVTYEREFGRRTGREFPFVDALIGGGPALDAPL
jgi:DNA helicase-2/ATP-dependent DNA helicase PcrA